MHPFEFLFRLSVMFYNFSKSPENQFLYPIPPAGGAVVTEENQ
jgi:hypothetical protein